MSWYLFDIKYIIETYLNKCGILIDTMDESFCTVYKTLEVIGKKWNLLIVQSIYKGGSDKKRYSEIKKDLHEITGKILSARLKELETNKLIKKEVLTSQTPISTYYSLTLRGFELTKIIQDMKKWGLKHEFKNSECEASNCRYCKI